MRRVPKPGAPFVPTLSGRWCPPKAVQVWLTLHAFERVGLVLGYLRRAGGFTALGAESPRDWPWREDDADAKQMAFADPVFAVCGGAAWPQCVRCRTLATLLPISRFKPLVFEFGSGFQFLPHLFLLFLRFLGFLDLGRAHDGRGAGDLGPAPAYAQYQRQY